jgi:hypothetical protein
MIEEQVDFATLTPFDAQYLTAADFTEAELAAQGHPERMVLPIYTPDNSRLPDEHQRHAKEQESQAQVQESRAQHQSLPQSQLLPHLQSNSQAQPASQNSQDTDTPRAPPLFYQARRHNNAGFGATHTPNRRWLTRSRGVFIRCVPRNITLFEIFSNIRGGVVERVTVQPGAGERNDVNVFFVSSEAASTYRGFVQKNGGIFWIGEQNKNALPSFAGLVAPQFGGHLRMKESMEKAVVDGATRCLEIAALPYGIDKQKLLKDIKSQHIVREVEYESLEFSIDNLSYRQHPARATIRFASIGMALGVKQFLTRLPEYHGASITFTSDPCAGPLSELILKWKMEHNEATKPGLGGLRPFQTVTPRRWMY